jgi:hypothetical protein
VVGGAATTRQHLLSKSRSSQDLRRSECAGDGHNNDGLIMELLVEIKRNRNTARCKFRLARNYTMPCLSWYSEVWVDETGWSRID